MPVPLSILDLATAARDQTMAQALEGTVALSQKAEETGYERVWYAEHHNMASIGSSATSVLIAHVAAHTKTIRLGAGGIMLPNHAPLVIAEQFGTLETLHPGRIDLGLGRAPGTDQNTMRALRRSGAKADTFPEDVMELQAYLQGQSRIPGVNAYPGQGHRRPAVHPRLLAVRRRPRRHPRPARTPSPRTSPPVRFTKRSRCTAASSSRPSSSRRLTSSPVSTSSPPTTRPTPNASSTR